MRKPTGSNKSKGDKSPPSTSTSADAPPTHLSSDGLAEMRFIDAIGVSLRGDTIVIRHPESGASAEFSKGAMPLLNHFMNWTSLQALVHSVLESGVDEPLNQLLNILHDLLRIEVLMTRQQDLTGARLPPPGAGWTEVMRFLADTRTTVDSIYALPSDFNFALEVKSATVCQQPSAFYERVNAPFHLLPRPQSRQIPPSALSFPEVLAARRTSRRYADQPLTELQLSTLLFNGWGMVSSVENPLGDVFVRKAAPSGGSLHPIEVYPIILRVEGIPSGFYHYSVRRHGLEELSREDPVEWIAKACGDQQWISEAGVVFLCTAFLPRTAWKYDYARVGRAVMFEVGFTNQCALLTAAWLGLGAFTTAALRDEMFEQKLDLDPSREPVLCVTGAGRLEADHDDHSRPRYESSIGVETA